MLSVSSRPCAAVERAAKTAANVGQQLQLQFQLKPKLCLRVISTLFMQHSAHDATCNIAKIVKCRRRAVYVDVHVDVVAVNVAVATATSSNGPNIVVLKLAEVFGNCTNAVAAHVKMRSTIRKGFDCSERQPKCTQVLRLKEAPKQFCKQNPHGISLKSMYIQKHYASGIR